MQIVITGNQSVRDPPLINEFFEFPDHRIRYIVLRRADMNKTEIGPKLVKDRVVIGGGDVGVTGIGLLWRDGRVL